MSTDQDLGVHGQFDDTGWGVDTDRYQVVVFPVDPRKTLRRSSWIST